MKNKILILILLALSLSFLSCAAKRPHNPPLPRCEEWVCRGDFFGHMVGKECNCLED